MTKSFPQDISQNIKQSTHIHHTSLLSPAFRVGITERLIADELNLNDRYAGFLDGIGGTDYLTVTFENEVLKKKTQSLSKRCRISPIHDSIFENVNDRERAEELHVFLS